MLRYFLLVSIVFNLADFYYERYNFFFSTWSWYISSTLLYMDIMKTLSISFSLFSIYLFLCTSHSPYVDLSKYFPFYLSIWIHIHIPVSVYLFYTTSIYHACMSISPPLSPCVLSHYSSNSLLIPFFFFVCLPTKSLGIITEFYHSIFMFVLVWQLSDKWLFMIVWE